MAKKPISRTSLMAMAILLIGVCHQNSAKSDGLVAGTWTRKANIPTARFLAGSAVVDGKIYVVGGNPHTASGSRITNIAEEYDPATDTWTRLANMPTARQGARAAAVDGIVYAIGGNGGAYNDVEFGNVEAYDPTTNTWTAKTDMPTPRTNMATVTVDGKIYVMGGGEATLHLPVEVYDPATDTWATKADVPTGRWGLAACEVNGKIYVFGGATRWAAFPPFNETPNVEVYDPATDTWTQASDMPRARFTHSATAVDGKIYIIGGANTDVHISPSLGFVIVDVYDPATDTWTTAADHPTGAPYNVTGVVDGKIYSITKWSGPGGIIFPDVYEYAPFDLNCDLNQDEKVDFRDLAMLAPLAYDGGDLDAEALALLAENWLEDLRLVGHWKLDEQDGAIAYDSAGNNDGTLHGDPNWQATAGSVAGAIDLDGMDDYVSTDFVLDPAYTPFSVFAWVKAGAPGQVVISQAGGSGRTWLAADPNGMLMTDLRAPAGRTFGPPLVSKFLITDGNWHQIGLVWDGSYRHLYTDGNEVATDIDDQKALVGADGGLYFGAEKTLSTTGFFDGMIDDIRIYDQAVTP